MSTERESESNPPAPSADDFRNLLSEGEPPSSDVALDQAQKELDDECDARKGERFYWICLTVILFDIFTFKEMGTWSGPIVIGILEFVVIISLGRKLGNDQIWTLTELIIRKWDGKIKE